jgi:hypothetical protein
MGSAGGSLAKLLKAGAGKPGYCKLCSFDDPIIQDGFDSRVLDYSPQKLNDWLKTKIEDHKPVSRGTIYTHRRHVMSPQDRVVQATQRRDMVHGKQPQRVEESEFLDAVISLGHTNALADPSAITVDQALKATQIKQSAKAKGDAHQTLVAIFTGNYTPETVIEGEAKEV